MLKLINEKRRWIYSALCLIALTGFTLPTLHLNIHLIGTLHFELGFMSLFSRTPQTEASGGNLDFGEIMTDSNLLSSVDWSLILAVGLYFLALLLLAVCLVLTLTNKFETVTTVILGLSFTGFFYSGIRFLSLPTDLSDVLEEALIKNPDSPFGLMADFIDFSSIVFSEIIQINLGAGYWLTILTSGTLLLLKIVCDLMNKLASKSSFK